MGWTFVYLGLCRLLQLAVLLCRSERSKELEILLLRHELAILRRQPRRAQVRPVDHSWLSTMMGTSFTVSLLPALQSGCTLARFRWGGSPSGGQPCCLARRQMA